MPATAAAIIAATPAAQPIPSRSPSARSASTPSLRPSTAPGAAPERWSAAELAVVRAELERERRELTGEIAEAEETLDRLQRDGNDGAGDDQADAGAATFEREHEMSLANNTREVLAQVGRALDRLQDGTYGRCESCGMAISKARLQAFPRVTLCVACKQREERY